MSTVTITIGTDSVTIPAISGDTELIIQTVADAPAAGSYITDHSTALNLDADDHTQYHNDARGDARYVQLAHEADTSIHFTSADLAATYAPYAHIDDATIHYDQASITIAYTQITGYGDLSPSNVGLLTGGADTTLHIHDADRARANHTGFQELGTVEVKSASQINSPTSNINGEQFHNFGMSAGATTTTAITHSGSGLLSCPLADFFIRSTTDGSGTLYSAQVAADASSITVADNSTAYIYIDYNSGTPQWAQTADIDNIDMSSQVLVAIASRRNTTVWIMQIGADNINFAAKSNRKTFTFERIKKQSGGVLSNPSALQIAVTSGDYWHSFNEINHLALSGGGSFNYFNYNGSTWAVASTTAISATQYNDTSTGLVSLTTDYFTNAWVYALFGNGNGSTEYAVIYGQAEYATAGQCANEDPPTTLPPHVADVGYLVGAAIVQEGASTLDSVRQYDDNQKVLGQNQLTSSEYLKTTGLGWKDIVGIYAEDTSGPTRPTKNAFISTVDVFSYSSGDAAEYYFHMPHDYALGTDLYIHAHWGHNGTSISGNMIWDLTVTYASRTASAPYSTFTTAITPSINSNSISSTMNITNFPQYCHVVEEIQLSASSPTATQLDTGNLDTDGLILVHVAANTIPSITGGSPNEPFLFFIDIHYQSDTFHTPNKDPDFRSPTYT